MPNKKILPLNINPVIKTYPFNAFYLGILEANGLDVSDILISEFLNLHCYYYQNDWHIDFGGSGFVEKKRFITKYDIIIKTININQIKSKIDNDFYLMLNLNEKNLGVSEIHWDYNRCHDWLIYGYDDSCSEFYCCGYINQKGGGEHYGIIKVKYNNLITSIKTVPKAFTLCRPHKLKNHSLKINYVYQEKVMSGKKLTKKIKSFYNPRKIQFHHAPSILNDVDGIKFFIKMLKRKYAHISSTGIAPNIYLQDIRNLYEHKKVIKIVLERLECCQEIINEQDELTKAAYKNLIICAKHNIKPQKNIIKKIVSNIISIENQQRLIIERVILEML